MRPRDRLPADGTRVRSARSGLIESRTSSSLSVFVTRPFMTTYQANNLLTNASNHIILRFDPLPIPLNSINLISPNFRSQSSFLNRICDSLCSALLDIDKEPDDKACENAVDESKHQTPSISTRKRAYKKMNACHVFPVLAMIAAQMFGPTRELTRLKIPYNPTLCQLFIVDR